jgi:hypothetical protein
MCRRRRHVLKGAHPFHFHNSLLGGAVLGGAVLGGAALGGAAL